MSELALHTPVAVTVKEFSCVYGDHQHDVSEACPTTEVNLCKACMPDVVLDDADVWELFVWPCAPRLTAERLLMSRFGFDVAEVQ